MCVCVRVMWYMQVAATAVATNLYSDGNPFSFDNHDL